MGIPVAKRKYICLQHDFNYLWGAPGRKIEYMGKELGPRMVFERIPAGDGMMVYRSLEGGFWTIADKMFIDLRATDVATATRFREVWFEDDRVALLADNGRFVSIPTFLGKGPVMVTTDAAGDAEKFWFEVPPVGLVPENLGQTSEKLEVDIGPKLTDSASLAPVTAVRETTTRIEDAVKGHEGISGSPTTTRRSGG